MATKEANVKVVIAGEFKKKGFNDANKSLSVFDKTVNRLGKRLLGVFALTKVVAFGKASYKAFTEDEKAASRLAVSVKNLGLAFAQPQIDNYIAKLEASSGILDDQLRPAFQALLTTTGSLTQSQTMLSQAINISRGSGIDLTTVAQDLANAYVGNTKGLKKYNLGLTQAQLKTASYTEIQAKFNQQFAGAQQAYLETYAGKLNKLTVASNNAKETIGKGLVDALTLAGGQESNVQSVADAMDSLALFTADAARGVGVLIGKLSDLDKFGGGFLGKLLKASIDASPAGLLAQIGKDSKPRPRAGRTFFGGQQANLYSSSAAAEAKFRKEQLDLLKKANAASAKAAALEKAKLSLSKASAVFDLNKISTAAALQATYDKETKLRLLAMQAIEENNGELAMKYINQLATLQNNADMAKLAGITTISDAQLASIDKTLLAELQSINVSKMAQEEKDRLIQIAFGKYNEALKLAGGLADANSYSERTQILQNEVLKEASIHAGFNTMLTATMLLESAQNDSIKRVASAQALADKARMDALTAYINVLNSVSPTATIGPSGAVSVPSSVLGLSAGGNNTPGASFADVMTGRQQFEAGLSGGLYGSTPVVNISAGVISAPDDFALLLQRTLQRLNRQGDPTGVAGAL